MSDQAMVAEIVAEVLRRMEGSNSTANPEVESGKAEVVNLPDLTSSEQRSRSLLADPVDPEALARMMGKTAARIGIGRAGPRLKTKTLLTLRADHAVASDAVHAEVNPDLLERLGLFTVQTRCSCRNQHLTRPDLGRQFGEEALAEIKKRCNPRPKVQVYACDGLSSRAVEDNLENILPAISHGLSRHGVEIGTPFFVKYGRVPAMEAISEALDAEVTCVLIGERPGLAIAGSMSAYIAYRATVGMVESRRTVISNIHSRGTPAVEAGAYIADLIHKMLTEKASGLDLKL
ncbi:MAG: ethanolamine ammonia-lyase subunit EutC [Oscillospiraceae bacterium]|nr:ethanolamine ammonia-lyase subunit EutC [Oscillospiraceae bacterium]